MVLHVRARSAATIVPVIAYGHGRMIFMWSGWTAGMDGVEAAQRARDEREDEANCKNFHFRRIFNFQIFAKFRLPAIFVSNFPPLSPPTSRPIFGAKELIFGAK